MEDDIPTKTRAFQCFKKSIELGSNDSLLN
jgi:hypothetical protein